MSEDDIARGTDPQTEAMLAGAEVEKGAADDEAEHHPRTHAPDLPPRSTRHPPTDETGADEADSANRKNNPIRDQ